MWNKAKRAGPLHQKLKQFGRGCNFQRGFSYFPLFLLGRSRKNIRFSCQIIDFAFRVDILSFFSKSGKLVITGKKRGEDLCVNVFYTS